MVDFGKATRVTSADRPTCKNGSMLTRCMSDRGLVKTGVVFKRGKSPSQTSLEAVQYSPIMLHTRLLLCYTHWCCMFSPRGSLAKYTGCSTHTLTTCDHTGLISLCRMMGFHHMQTSLIKPKLISQWSMSEWICKCAAVRRKIRSHV